MGTLVEEIRNGWGYDHSGCWHGEPAEVVPIREEAETDNDDPLAPVRGLLWVLLFSAYFGL